MQDFTELQDLCEKHKQIVNIIQSLQDLQEAANSQNKTEITILVTAGIKTKIDLDTSKETDKQTLYSLLNGYRQVERELSQKVNNFFNHN